MVMYLARIPHIPLIAGVSALRAVGVMLPEFVHRWNRL